MIPRTIATWQTKSWQEELSNLITTPKELFELLNIDEHHLPAAENAAKLFPLRVTRSFVDRIKPNNLDDPLLRQILPIGNELVPVPGYSEDPLEEPLFSPTPGLIHKYHGRVLLIAANQCAINCRYCFRRNFDYEENALSRSEWERPLDYISKHKEIDEVILSGGDPMAVSDRQLSWLIEQVERIEHVKRLRIHSRMPIVAPMRITDAFAEMITSSRLQTVLVIHCNHEQELSKEVIEALTALRSLNTLTLLNQTVLLRGVNDDAESLINLSKALFTAGVLPYYLHILDKVSGTSHFNVNEATASSINASLLANLPGYLVPKLVKEVPNAPSKVPII